MISPNSLAKYVTLLLVAVIASSVLCSVSQYFLFRDVSYAGDYDYVVYVEDGIIKVKNGISGKLDFTGQNFTQIMNYVLRRDDLKIFIQRAEYDLTGNILLESLEGVKIVSNGAMLKLNGNNLIIRGASWEESSHNYVEGLIMVSGGIIIENSFMTTIKNCRFIDPENAITLINSNGWTECTLIERCYFINPSRRGIVFCTPINNGTRSYANTEITQCYFELRSQGAIGIHVEPGADFNEGLLQNARFWMGAVAEFNQTGIYVEGSMLNTLMQNVVFESFAFSPQGIYGLVLGEKCDPPIIGHGVVFCGNLTSSISNTRGKWIYGAGGSFKEKDVQVPIGMDGKYGPQMEIGVVPHLALAITSMNVKVQVNGNFSEGEVVYVRFKFKFIDGNFSKQLEIKFNEAGCIWLGNEEWLDIWPTRHIITSLIVDAKSTAKKSGVTVKVSMYGQYG